MAHHITRVAGGQRRFRPIRRILPRPQAEPAPPNCCAPGLPPGRPAAAPCALPACPALPAVHRAARTLGRLPVVVPTLCSPRSSVCVHAATRRASARRRARRRRGRRVRTATPPGSRGTRRGQRLRLARPRPGRPAGPGRLQRAAWGLRRHTQEREGARRPGRRTRASKSPATWKGMEGGRRARGLVPVAAGARLLVAAAAPARLRQSGRQPEARARRPRYEPSSSSSSRRHYGHTPYAWTLVVMMPCCTAAATCAVPQLPLACCCWRLQGGGGWGGPGLRQSKRQDSLQSRRAHTYLRPARGCSAPTP